MTAAQCKAARLKNRIRYGGAHRHVSVAEAIEIERQKAMRQAAAKSRKKNK